MASIPLPPTDQDWVLGNNKPTQAFALALTQLFAQGMRNPISGALFGNLPSPATAGAIAYVTDSTVNTWGSVVAGGGGNKVLAFYNGTNWTVFAA